MKLFSARTFFEVLTEIFINLTSGWFGILLVAPGIFGVSSFPEYGKLLLLNIPFGVLGLLTTLLLKEKVKKL